MNACERCGAPIAAERLVIDEQAGHKAALLCLDCVADEKRAGEVGEARPNLLLALLMGVVGAVAGCLVWYTVVVYTNWEMPWAALGVGALVGYVVVAGAGDQRGPWLQVISGVTTLVALAINEYFLVRLVVVSMFSSLVGGRLPLFMNTPLMGRLIVTDLSESPWRPIFMVGGVALAAIIPARWARLGAHLGARGSSTVE